MKKGPTTSIFQSHIRSASSFLFFLSFLPFLSLIFTSLLRFDIPSVLIIFVFGRHQGGLHRDRVSAFLFACSLVLCCAVHSVTVSIRRSWSSRQEGLTHLLPTSLSLSSYSCSQSHFTSTHPSFSSLKPPKHQGSQIPFFSLHFYKRIRTLTRTDGFPSTATSIPPSTSSPILFTTFKMATAGKIWSEKEKVHPSLPSPRPSALHHHH